MQTYNITQLKADIAGIGHGTSLNKVQNFDGLVLRAARQVMSDIDLKETIRETTFKIYKGVYNYSIPDDIKGNKIVDLYPTNRDWNVKVYNNRNNQSFNRNMVSGSVNNDFNFKYDTYSKTLNINANQLPDPIIIDKAVDSTTYSGTITNLITDPINYKVDKSSIKFKADNGQYIEKTFTTSLDLTDHLNLSDLFFDIDLSGTVTSLDFRVFNDNSNYFTWNITSDMISSALNAGWHTIKVSWDTATTVGSPNASTINGIRLTVNTASPVICNINNFQSNLGVQYNLSYYSERFFRNNLTGEFESKPSSDSSFINASDEGYNMFINQVAMFMVQQVQGESQTSDYNFFAGEYKRCLEKQKMEYKSQIQKPQEYYYKIYG